MAGENGNGNLTLSSVRNPVNRALELAACDEALQQLRSFKVSEHTVEFLGRRAESRPDSAGCGALYLGARMLYNAQLKAYLDMELEEEFLDTIRRVEGTPEEALLRHTLSIASDYSDEEDILAADNFFEQQLEYPGAKEKFPHFRFLRVLCQLKLAQRKIGTSEEFSKVREDFRDICATSGRPAIIRQLMARFGTGE